MTDTPTDHAPAAPEDNADPTAEGLSVNDTTLTVLGEVLDLLAGIEARQKVLAREIATTRAVLHNQPVDDVMEDLHEAFTENLETERNRILSRVSLLSSFPAQDNEESVSA